MPTLLTTEAAICIDRPPPWSPDDAQLAAAAFLARYSDRTLEAYRHDLRYYFQWAADQHLDVLAATRAHIEVYRSTMEQRGLAASTIDRRLSTVCGYYRFPTSMVASSPTPPSTCVDPRFNRPNSARWTEVSSDASCSQRSATADPTPVLPCCSA